MYITVLPFFVVHWLSGMRDEVVEVMCPVPSYISTFVHILGTLGGILLSLRVVLSGCISVVPVLLLSVTYG